jgi:hypothetical protein
MEKWLMSNKGLQSHSQTERKILLLPEFETRPASLVCI